MFLSKRSNGIYCLFYFDDTGPQHKISSATTKSEAHAFVRNYKANIKGATPEKRYGMKLSEFLKVFYVYSNVNLAPESVDLYTLVLKDVFQVIGDLPLDSITPFTVDRIKTHLLEKVKPITVNMRLARIKGSLNVAIRWELLDKRPFRHVKWVTVNEMTLPFICRG
jgi:hypothetical protein